ncbi:hypothetical protein COT29_00445 [Candidatus Micrarchaeota archaeon CG08_land_8_20_14_0_20_59_11]|nr:MAG: hypothetical protein COT29_00445 [Candidatus Micrarchaeota archaeon CG08_land_8_20_14_0_20_59_11]
MDRRVLLLLVGALLLSLYTHVMVFSEWHMPTYGNTMIHVAAARHLVEHGYYPLDNDYSYGGGISNLYVPVYRFALAEGVFLTGADYDIISRLFVMAFALLVPLGFFLLGRTAFGEWAGVAAAFLSSLVPELLIYTVRPLPQGMGLALLPIAFYLMITGRRAPALAAAFIVSLVHQEAAVFLVGVAAAFFGLKLLEAALRWSIDRGRFALGETAITAFACAALGTATYFAWHFFATGNLDVFSLAQFQHHEGNAVDYALLLSKTGRVVLALSIAGAFACAWAIYEKWKTRKIDAELFAFGVALAGLGAIKNDVFGLRVFMDRFIVFLSLGLILLAAFGLTQSVRVLKKIVPGERK